MPVLLFILFPHPCLKFFYFLLVFFYFLIRILFFPFYLLSSFFHFNLRLTDGSHTPYFPLSPTISAPLSPTQNSKICWLK